MMEEKDSKESNSSQKISPFKLNIGDLYYSASKLETGISSSLNAFSEINACINKMDRLTKLQSFTPFSYPEANKK